MTGPGPSKAREHDAQGTIAEARCVSSFSELVNPYGLCVQCFVSHYWGHDFTSTVTALDLWADAHHQALISTKEALVFWICLFALNQHKKGDEVGESPQQGPFNAALAQATGGAVMILDEKIKAFIRIWCLFGICRLKELSRPFELAPCPKRAFTTKPLRRRWKPLVKRSGMYAWLTRKAQWRPTSSRSGPRLFPNSGGVQLMESVPDVFSPITLNNGGRVD